MRPALLASLLLLSAPAVAGSPTLKQMQSVYDNLNEICRGGSGDHKETLETCDVRSKVGDLIEAMRGRSRR